MGIGRVGDPKSDVALFFFFCFSSMGIFEGNEKERKVSFILWGLGG